MLQKYILFLKRHPLITAAIAITYAILCLKCVPAETDFQVFLVRTMLCGAMAFFLYQISGDKTLTSSYNSTGYVIKVASGFWIISFIMGVISLLSMAASGAKVNENPVKHIIILFLMFLFVGLFEEMAFRAVINDAIIYAFRDKKYVFVLSAVVSSVVFGAAHVIGFDVSSGLAWAQAVGKTASAGFFGLVLLFLYWKTRNIWACGVVHGVYDFMISFGSGIYDTTQETHHTYVAPDEAAIPVIITYAVMILITLFILWRVWKKIGKQIDYNGIRENW